MLKRISFILLICTASQLIINCSEQPKRERVNQMFQTIQYLSDYHLQSEKDIKILKDQKVKSLSILKRDVAASTVDSLTYIEYDEGKIISRTTDECTTIVCLPYTVKQIYTYDDNKIVKMSDYTFKKKYSSKKKVLECKRYFSTLSV